MESGQKKMNDNYTSTTDGTLVTIAELKSKYDKNQINSIVEYFQSLGKKDL